GRGAPIGGGGPALGGMGSTHGPRVGVPPNRPHTGDGLVGAPPRGAAGGPPGAGAWREGAGGPGRGEGAAAGGAAGCGGGGGGGGVCGDEPALPALGCTQ